LCDKTIKLVAWQVKLVREVLQCGPQYFCVDRSAHFAEQFHHGGLLRSPELKEQGGVGWGNISACVPEHRIVVHNAMFRRYVRIFARKIGPGIVLDNCRPLLGLPLVPRTLNASSSVLLCELIGRPLALAQRQLPGIRPSSIRMPVSVHSTSP
jgi:hypothetical protein